MSILNDQQRAVVRADTGIDPIIIDRCCDAFDALERDDVEAYVRYMRTAITQMGFEKQIPNSERPTAVDKIKTICIRAAADKRGWPYRRMAAYFRRQLEGAT
jgi:hypothetical protein